jgi:hypothetical protein
MVMFKAAAVSSDSIEKRFNAMPKVSSVTSRAKELQSFFDLMDTTVIFIGS